MLTDERHPVIWTGQRIAKKPAKPGGEIVAIAPDTPAEHLDLRPGDRILSINGQELHDVIDYQFATADDSLALVVERSGHTRTIKATQDQTRGVRFKDPAFDGITWCNNKCPFCFVKMNPAKARPSLYLKDDDFRYSALYGNFVTLTNLTDESWRRIEQQRLSPLYVSVHATDLTLRRRLLGNPTAPDVLSQLDRLRDIGVTYHTQAVLCPGINDGAALDQTIEQLADRHPAALSLSLVPVGLTGVGRHPEYLRRHTADEAAAIVARANAYRKRFRGDFGFTWLYPSDELYLMGGVTVPPARHYDGYAQYQNGVGMVRSLFDEWAHLRRRATPLEKRLTVVTGTLIAPHVAPMLAQLGAELVPVENRYFGSIVNVAGLLTARDILDALKSREKLGDLVALPRSALDTPGERFLDDVTPAQFEAELGRPIAFVETLKDLLTCAG